MADDEYVDEEEEEIDLESINDEQILIEMLDETEDFDERKKIRDRLMKVQHEVRAKRAEMLRRREEEREQMLKKKMQEAEERKKRTLAMYDDMAKSAPAGAKKTMDVNIYKSNDASSRSESPAPRGGGKKDLVEDAIRQRAREAELRKKRILAAYEHAAKSGPAGPKIVNFDDFKRADVSNYTPTPTSPGSCTFSMSGGIPKFEKPPSSKPGTPVAPMGAPNFRKDEEDLDPMERAIRERKREADERKRRILAAYDMAAKTGPGPKANVLDEFRISQVAPESQSTNKYDPTASFHAGVPLTAGGKR